MADNPIVVITLHDGTFSVPITVEKGLEGLPLQALTPNSIFSAGGGPGKYGDNEPLFAFNEQRTWEGGRALEFFSDDQTRYYDSHRAWSLTPGKLGPAPQWFFGIGHRPNGAEFTLPGNVAWKPLYEDTRYISRTVTMSATVTADKAYAWIRRVGNPGDLTLEVCADSSGEPGSAAKTIAISTSDITDYESVLVAFDWSSTTSMTGSSTYHLKWYGAASDDADNHWQIAADITTSNSLQSDDDSTWSTAPFSAYYRIVGADISVRWEFFIYDEVTYAVSKYADQTTASKLFMNGARGIATGATSTTLTDSNASFGTSSEYDGALVKIIRGTGKGQVRTISSHTGTALTVPAWDKTPDTTSQYKVYQTPRWTEIGSTGLGTVKSVAVVDKLVVFAQGSGDDIRHMEWDETSPGHAFRDDGNSAEADVVAKGYVAGTGNVIWRAVNGDGGVTVSRQTAPAYGADTAFGSNSEAGDGQYPVTNMVHFTDGANSRMYILKTGELGYIDNDKYYKMNVDFASFPESTNGKAALAHGLYLYTNWSWTLERIYGTAVDDIDPNREAGFPSDRQGYIAALAGHPVGPMAAVDAGDDGYSHILFFDGVGYHEIFRAWETGKSISDIHWQANEGGKKYLWIGVGDDLVYMEFPRFHRNPFADTTQNYMHEFSITTATYDMGNSSIYKAWKDISIITKNLDGIGTYAEVDYQTDGDIDSTTWTQINAGLISKSPADTLDLFLGEIQQIRFRIRFLTDDAMTPPIVNSIVVKGVGQNQIKFGVTFNASFGPTASSLGGDNLYGGDLIKKGARTAKIWTIEKCNYEELVGWHMLAQINDVRPKYKTTTTNVESKVTLFVLDDDEF